MERVDPSGQTIYAILEEKSFSLVRAEKDYVARALTVPFATPLFSVDRHSIPNGDRLPEYRLSNMRGERCKYRIDFR